MIILITIIAAYLFVFFIPEKKLQKRETRPYIKKLFKKEQCKIVRMQEKKIVEPAG